MAQQTLDYLDKTHQGKALEDLFERVFAHVLDYLKKEGSYEVSLSLLDEKEQQDLNRRYRDIDRATDVLTFAYQEQQEPEMPVVDLGSITICPAVAKRQAKEYRHPYKRELAFLFIHGLLHIFGYDHMKDEDAKVMFPLQNAILDSLAYDFYTNESKLQKSLLEARERSLATYSHFRVGAVVVTKDGKYIPGFNIENSSYPATVCAERVALFTAYSMGYSKEDIVSLGCVTDSKNVGTCCGVCRQVMSELMKPNAAVYIYSGDMKRHLFTTVRDLLPNAFTKEDLCK